MNLLSMGLFCSLLVAQASDERGLTVREAGAFEGLTMISPLTSKSTFLVDMDGDVVHRWDTDYAPGNLAYLLPNGNLLRAARHEDNPVFWGGGIGGRIQEFTWDGELVWDYLLSDEDRCMHHDIEPLPNGNILCIIWERLTREDAILFGREPAATSAEGFWPDAVLELQPDGPNGAKIVWEWHVLDHLIQDVDPEKPNYGSVADQPERLDINADHRSQPPLTKEERERQAEAEDQMRALGYVGGGEDKTPEKRADGRTLSADWMHTNSVNWFSYSDVIVLSSPRLNEIWVIDHSTTTEEAAGTTGGRWGRGGDILWRWGNPKNYGAGTEDHQRLFAQHDASWLLGGDGSIRLLIFNNGQGRPDGSFSSVDELIFPYDSQLAPDPSSGPQGFAPLKLSWTYRAPNREDFFSSFISGAQRLPNGNTLICSGAPGRVFEVNRKREIVWEYLNPHGGEIAGSFGKAAGGRGSGVPPNALFRATRIAKDDPGLARLAQ